MSVVVTENGIGGYGQQILADKHVLNADEPEPIGRGTAPDPYQLLLGSLGACTSMTVRMYAERKGWPLEKVTVTLSHQRVHSRDCEDCEDKNVMIDEITKQIQLDGPLNDEQRAALHKIAEKCPVHRTLTGTIKIRSI
ncbi:OsmC family peroxiredoxin [Pseudonocardiaceae bacterium YIM PH 21723]|nr:OsmC family peroxiredoxin [Pseudonocardiaceae bacterium YIM PH 21723]